LELRKAKHCFAQVAACEANASKELSPGLAESWAEICSGFREGKLQGRKHETLQLFLHPLHQYCYACVKESMQRQTFQFPFGCWLYQSNPNAFLTQKSPHLLSLHLVPAVAG